MNSPEVTSNQQDVHPQLLRRLARYRTSEFRRPPHDASRAAFEAATHLWQASGKPLILDSGCGIGDSTIQLARLFPEHFVLGVDKSRERLRRGTQSFGALQSANFACIRADLIDFWRLARAAGWTPQRHYVLYPNPWPKSEHLVRRWHAHPVFGDMLALGGALELRTNWKTYAAEFGIALALYDLPCTIRLDDGSQGLTPFERKYLNSGHKLYRLCADLNAYAASLRAAAAEQN